jgi:hypothetical protein
MQVTGSALDACFKQPVYVDGGHQILPLLAVLFVAGDAQESRKTVCGARKTHNALSFKGLHPKERIN